MFLNLVVWVKPYAYPALQSKISHVWQFVSFGCIASNRSSKRLEGTAYLEWTTVRTNTFSVLSIIYHHFTILQFNTSLHEVITYMYLFVNVVGHRLTREKLKCSLLLRIQDKITKCILPSFLTFRLFVLGGFANLRFRAKNNNTVELSYNVERGRTICVYKLVSL